MEKLLLMATALLDEVNHLRRVGGIMRPRGGVGRKFQNGRNGSLPAQQALPIPDR